MFRGSGPVLQRNPIFCDFSRGEGSPPGSDVNNAPTRHSRLRTEALMLSDKVIPVAHQLILGLGVRLDRLIIPTFSNHKMTTLF